MIWISTSKALPFTFAVFVVSASLKGLFVISRLSYESTSSLKELLEVSYRHGNFSLDNLIGHLEFSNGSSRDSDVKSFDSSITVTFALHLGCRALRNFLTKIENLNEVRVKELRSDNGIEFKNHKLEELCDEKGISRNFSSPCTPKQNSVAERRNITLIKAARTMLNKEDLLILANFPVFWSPVHIPMKSQGPFGKVLMKKSDDGILSWLPLAVLKFSGCST
ncbi:retrovirus-related pol polyprotein from transposon TNT 1-94 [Tanacetum coccineum]